MGAFDGKIRAVVLFCSASSCWCSFGVSDFRGLVFFFFPCFSIKNTRDLKKKKDLRPRAVSEFHFEKWSFFKVYNKPPCIRCAIFHLGWNCRDFWHSVNWYSGGKFPPKNAEFSKHILRVETQPGIQQTDSWIPGSPSFQLGIWVPKSGVFEGIWLISLRIGESMKFQTKPQAPTKPSTHWNLWKES